MRFSITGMMAYEIVSPIIARFFQTYPGIDVDLRVSDRMQDINRLEADVSLRIADEVTDDVVARKLYPLASAFYASPAYRERHLKTAGPKGQGLHLIGWDAIDRSPTWLKQSLFPWPKCAMRRRTDTYSSILRAVALGSSEPCHYWR